MSPACCRPQPAEIVPTRPQPSWLWAVGCVVLPVILAAFPYTLAFALEWGEVAERVTADALIVLGLFGPAAGLILYETQRGGVR